MSSLKFSTAASIVIAISGISASPAYSQDVPREESLETVQVVSVRDPDAFSVAKSMANIRLFDSIPAADRSQIRLSFHVFAKNGSPMPEGARMSLATDQMDRPMELLPHGELRVPLLSTEEAEGAAFVSNLRKGRLKVTYFIQPKMTSPMTMGYLRASMVQAKAAYKKLYGALLGWSVPSFTCAVATFSSKTTVTVRSGDTTAAWTSDPGTRLNIPLNDTSLHDDYVIDWGASAPHRLGGCVEEKKVSP